MTYGGAATSLRAYSASLRFTTICDLPLDVLTVPDPTVTAALLGSSCRDSNGTLPYGVNYATASGDLHLRTVGSSVHLRGLVLHEYVEPYCPTPLVVLEPSAPVINISSISAGARVVSIVTVAARISVPESSGLAVEKVGSHTFVVVRNASLLVGHERVDISLSSFCGATVYVPIVIIAATPSFICEPIRASSIDRPSCDSAPVRAVGLTDYISGTCTASCSPGTTFYCTANGWRFSGPTPSQCTTAFGAADRVFMGAEACAIAPSIFAPKGTRVAGEGLECYYILDDGTPIELKMEGRSQNLPVPSGTGPRANYNGRFQPNLCDAQVAAGNGTTNTATTAMYMSVDFPCEYTLDCLRKPWEDATPPTYTDSNWTACGLHGMLPNAYPPADATDFVLLPGEYDGYYAASDSFPVVVEQCSPTYTAVAAKYFDVAPSCVKLFDTEIGCVYFVANEPSGAYSVEYGTCFSTIPVFISAKVTYAAWVDEYLFYTTQRVLGAATTSVCAPGPGMIAAISDGKCVYYSNNVGFRSCGSTYKFRLYSPEPFTVCDEFNCIPVGFTTQVGTVSTYTLPYQTAFSAIRFSAEDDTFKAFSDEPTCQPIYDTSHHLFLDLGLSPQRERELVPVGNKLTLDSYGGVPQGYKVPLTTLPNNAIFGENWEYLRVFQDYLRSAYYAILKSPLGSFILSVKILAIFSEVLALTLWLYYGAIDPRSRFTRCSGRAKSKLWNFVVFVFCIFPAGLIAPFLLLLDAVALIILFVPAVIMAFKGRRLVMASSGGAFILQCFYAYRYRRKLHYRQLYGIMDLSARGNNFVGFFATWSLIAVLLPRGAYASYDSGTTESRVSFYPTRTIAGKEVTYHGTVDGYLAFGTGYKAIFDAVDSTDSSIAYTLTITLTDTTNKAACSYSHSCGSVAVVSKAERWKSNEACACAAINAPHCMFYEKSRTGCDSMNSASDTTNCQNMKGRNPGRCQDGSGLDYDDAVASWHSSKLGDMGNTPFLGEATSDCALLNEGALWRGSRVSHCFAVPSPSTEYVHVAACANLNLVATARVEITRTKGTDTEVVSDELVTISSWSTIDLPGTTVTFKPPDMTVSFPNNIGVHTVGSDLTAIFARIPGPAQPTSACNAFVGVPIDGPVLNVLNTGLSAHDGGCTLANNPVFSLDKFASGFGYLNTESECSWTPVVESSPQTACRDAAFNNAPLCSDEPKLPVDFEYDLPVVSLETASCTKIIPFTLTSELSLPWEEQESRIPGEMVTISGCVGAWGREGASCDVSTLQPGVFQQLAVSGEPQFSPPQFWLESITSAKLLLPTATAQLVTMWDGTVITIDKTNIQNPILSTPDENEGTNTVPDPDDPGSSGFNWLDFFKTFGIVFLGILGGLIGLWLLYISVPFLLTCCCSTTTAASSTGTRSAILSQVLNSRRRGKPRQD